MKCVKRKRRSESSHRKSPAAVSSKQEYAPLQRNTAAHKQGGKVGWYGRRMEVGRSLAEVGWEVGREGRSSLTKSDGECSVREKYSHSDGVFHLLSCSAWCLYNTVLQHSSMATHSLPSIHTHCAALPAPQSHFRHRRTRTRTRDRTVDAERSCRCTDRPRPDACGRSAETGTRSP